MTIIKSTGPSLSRRSFLARTAGTTALLLAGRSLLPGVPGQPPPRRKSPV